MHLFKRKSSSSSSSSSSHSAPNSPTSDMSGLLAKIGGSPSRKRGASNANADDSAPPPGAQESETEVLCAHLLSTTTTTMAVQPADAIPYSDENEGSIIMSLISQLRYARSLVSCLSCVDAPIAPDDLVYPRLTGSGWTSPRSITPLLAPSLLSCY